MGKLIVIEGLDGSGKATQTERLYELLARCTPGCRRISFPDYASPSSALVRMYLSGELGTLDEINPYGASIFYAADRYASFQRDWKRDYDAGALIVADRYATSNIAYQMTKLPHGDWDAYIDWLEDLEYRRIGMPRPALVVYLDMQPETSRRLLAKRYCGDAAKLDLHEADLDYLLRCREAALYGAEKQGWKILSCCDGSQPLSQDAVAQKIQETVKEYLC